MTDEKDASTGDVNMISPQQQHFEQFLGELSITAPENLIPNLSAYQEMLMEYNQKINLVSRKMEAELYWTQHFLDSMLILKCLNFSGRSFLDFGCGGGLPGIPIKLAQPDSAAHFLDSSQKKIHALDDIIQWLGLEGTRTYPLRLEDLAKKENPAWLDFIICRAVAMEERYRLPLKKMLKPGGKVIFYKARRLEDLNGLDYTIEYETEDAFLGLRRIISLKRSDL